ncbi:MAG: choice-of-anchor D domain-containing protein [Gammaproteobacteria bacterium]|nr:choice-of-anchor D domain-containing protein [Gammaproteobacteria bacterium]
MRENGVTTQISQGAINGNGSNSVTYAGASPDGSRVFFTTAEPLASTDTDTESDIYMRHNGVTTHISQGAINGNGAAGATYLSASADGSRAFFSTPEPLASTDTDALVDIYLRENGVTTLITPNTTSTLTYGGLNADGSKVFFSTSDALASTDTDAVTDVYSVTLSPGPVLSAVSASSTLVGGVVSNVLKGTSDTSGTGYYIAVAPGSAAPTAVQVEAAASYSGVSIVASGNGAMTAAVQARFTLGGLAGATSYDLYLIVSSNGSTSAVSKTSLTTLSASTDGSCGTASARPTASVPGDAALCATGTASAVTSNGSFSWNCTGSGGGTDAVCTAPYQTQTLSLSANPTSIKLGGSSTLTASSSSGASPMLSTTTPTICTLSGSAAAGDASGICTVNANVAASASGCTSGCYQAAPEKSVDITVSKLDQTISFDAAPVIVVGGSGTVSASAPGGTVIFNTAGQANCSSGGSNGSIITGLKAGPCTVSASQAGDAIYSSASGSQSISIGQGSQSISFGAAPSGLKVGDSTSLSATASSGLTVSFSSNTTGICTVSGSTVTGVSAGTCTVSATQVGNPDYSAAPAETQSFSIAPAASLSLVVNSTVDTSDGVCDATHCTLREAINAANANAGDDSITFAPALSGQTTVLASTLNIVAGKGSLNVTGPVAGSAAGYTVDGNNAVQLFTIAGGSSASSPNVVTFKGLTLTRALGAGKNGGAINTGNFVTLSIEDATLSNNVVNGSKAGGAGGAVYLGSGNGSGSFSLRNSTVQSNTASKDGGAIYIAGGTLSVQLSRFLNNTASSGGGAIGLENTARAFTVEGSSFSGNSAPFGGAIYSPGARGGSIRNSSFGGNSARSAAVGGGGAIRIGGQLGLDSVSFSGNSTPTGGAQLANEGHVVLTNTLFANPQGGGSNCSDVTIDTTSRNNISSDTSCNFPSDPSNLSSTDPRLVPLALNAPGSTETFALCTGVGTPDASCTGKSPAIDAGSTTLTTDQRGVARPVGTAADIGAYEAPAAVIGGCGEASNVASVSAPAAALCATGTASSVTSTGGQWSWSCSGANGGAPASCAAPYAAQTLTLTAVPTSILINNTSAVTASSTSGFKPVLSSSTPAVCTLGTQADTATGVGATATGKAQGSCTVKANAAQSADGCTSCYQAASEATVDISVNKRDQTIRFGTAPNLVINGTGTLTATSDSELTVSLSDAMSAVCSIDSNGLITVLKAGTCTIQATQAGNDVYNAAEPATLSITIDKLTQQISGFSADPSSIKVGGMATLTASGGASGNAVTFRTTTGDICSVSGAVVTGLSAGNCALIASQNGNADYEPADEVSLSLPVAKAAQLISGFAVTPSSLKVGESGTLMAFGGASGNALTFASTTQSVCTVAGSTVTANAVGSCTVTASQTGSDRFNAAETVSLTFAVEAAPVTAAPVLSLDMNDLDFGTGYLLRFRDIGVETTSEPEVVTLSNTGTAPLSISSIVTTGDFRHTTTCGSTVAPGARCTISIVFSPKAVGTRTGETRIVSNAVTSPDRISLSGTGKGLKPAMKTNVSRFDFGRVKVGASSREQTLVITSTGSGPLEIRSIRVSGDYSGSHNCPRWLDAGKSCQVTGSFKPKAVGTRPGSVSILTSVSNTATEVSLTGTGF